MGAVTVGLCNRRELRWQIHHGGRSRGRHCHTPLPHTHTYTNLLLYISTISSSSSSCEEFSIVVCSVSLVSQAHHQVRKQGNPSLYMEIQCLYCVQSVPELVLFVQYQFSFVNSARGTGTERHNSSVYGYYDTDII